MTPSRLAGTGLLAVYIGSIVLANWLITRYGILHIGALLVPAGTFAIGGAIMTRDLLQDALGRIAVLAAIGTGALLSYAVASPRIAVASGITFLFAELAEFAVYTPLRRRYGWGTGRWSGVILLANVTGALTDTLLFLRLAGFPLQPALVGGQMAGKALVTLAVVAAGLSLRKHMARA